MKITSLFGAAILCLATSAFAHDMTYIGQVKPHETVTWKVELPEGKSTTQVSTSTPETISCTFYNSEGMVIFDAKSVSFCLYDRDIPADTISALITNESNQVLSLNIWVHSK